MNQKVFEKIKLPDVKHIIGISSGKGGAGKSAIAANLDAILVII